MMGARSIGCELHQGESFRAAVEVGVEFVPDKFSGLRGMREPVGTELHKEWRRWADDHFIEGDEWPYRGDVLVYVGENKPVFANDRDFPMLDRPASAKAPFF